MTRKVFNIVSTLIGVAQIASIAVMTYISTEYLIAINSSIVIVGTAAIEVCSQFVKD